MIGTVAENKRAGIGRPRWIFTGSDDNRIAALRPDDTNLESACQRSKSDPSPIGRPIGLGRVWRAVGDHSPRRAAGSRNRIQAGWTPLSRNVTNRLAVRRPAGRRFGFPGG